MAKIKIEEINLESDKEEISTWDTIYANTPEYKTIENYILEYHLLADLCEVIETNHDLINLDYREIKKALTIKNNKNEIIGFLLCLAYDMTDYSSGLYIQYIVLKPDSQHKGYGTNVLNEFFSNIRKYIGFEPTDVYAIIHRHNKSSISLFEKFGFDFSRRPMSRFYLRADNDLYTIKNIINQKSYE